MKKIRDMFIESVLIGGLFGVIVFSIVAYSLSVKFGGLPPLKSFDFTITVSIGSAALTFLIAFLEKFLRDLTGRKSFIS